MPKGSDQNIAITELDAAKEDNPTLPTQRRHCQIHREYIPKILPAVLSHISAAQNLRSTDQHHTERVQKMVDRTKHPDGSHGRLSNAVARKNAIYNSVHRVDDNQQHLIRQQLEVLFSDHLHSR